MWEKPEINKEQEDHRWYEVRSDDFNADGYYELVKRFPSIDPDKLFNAVSYKDWNPFWPFLEEKFISKWFFYSLKQDDSKYYLIRTSPSWTKSRVEISKEPDEFIIDTRIPDVKLFRPLLSKSYYIKIWDQVFNELPLDKTDPDFIRRFSGALNDILTKCDTKELLKSCKVLPGQYGVIDIDDGVSYHVNRISHNAIKLLDVTWNWMHQWEKIKFYELRVAKMAEILNAVIDSYRKTN